MWNRLLNSPLLYIYLFAGTVASTALGFLAGSKILLPLLNIAVSYPVLFSLMAAEKRKRAVGAMLFWAFCMAAVAVWASVRFPAHAEASIFHGRAYADEMLQWIRTGEGAEGDPARFAPQHLLHFIVFVALSIFSGSILSLLMGALLMNYMCFYVGVLIRTSVDPAMAAIMGWQPYAIIRVLSYVMLGVILGEPMMCRWTKRDYEYGELRPFFWAGIIGVILDILIKSLVAPWWGATLRTIIP